jgi:plastocyanin
MRPSIGRSRAFARSSSRAKGVFVLATLVAALVGSSTCGGGSSPTQPSNGGSNPALTITISASGASPRTLSVAAGSRITFVNTDSRAHEMTSDPHPTHEDCPELNQIGFLNPGQQRESGNLVQARTCGFHDHINPGTSSLNGTITIR